jgi:hypothetical protein
LIIDSAFKNTKDKKQLEILGKSLTNLKKIKEIEKIDLKNQDLELENILKEIDKI